ncbi:hypothetical protein [Brevibacillus sp. 179-C 1.1 NHS]|uniref:hypothetical protein n=1 Tax=Brevibacillus sp. 179-C 1.1 NHS TaxID=3235177 RepID=UPI00399F081E
MIIGDWIENYKILQRMNGTVIFELHFSSNPICKEVYLHLGTDITNNKEKRYYIRYFTFSMFEEDEIVELEIDQAIVQKIEEMLYDSKISIIPRQMSIGLDGYTYTIRVRNTFQKIEITWWCEPNEEWKPLGEIVDLIFGQLPSNIREIRMQH